MTPNKVKVFFQRMSQHPLVCVLILAVLVAFTTAGHRLYQSMITEQQQRLALSSAEGYAQQQANVVNQYLQQQHQRLNDFSNRDILTNAFLDNDPTSISRLETLLNQWLNDLVDGYLLSPGDLRLEQAHNFVGREMFLQVMQGIQPQPEAARLGSGWQILFAYPIKSTDNQIIGALIAGLSIDTLKTELSKLDKTLGNTELVQMLPGVPKNSFLSIKSSTAALEPVAAATALGHWQAQFTGSRALLQQSTPPAEGFYTLILALISAAMLVIYIIVRITLQRHQDKPVAKPKAKPVKVTDKPIDTGPGDTAAESYLQIIPDAEDAATKPAPREADPQPMPAASGYPLAVFRDYDIRGIFEEQLTADFALQLGKVLGAKALAAGETAIALAYDGRLSGPTLNKAFESGVTSTGCDIIHLGRVPTPMLNFATHFLTETKSGVMITASHNPKEYNGFKIFIQRHALCSEEILALRSELESAEFPTGEGTIEQLDLSADYIRAVTEDIVPSFNLKVVLDAGNGVAGQLAIDVLESIGCQVTPLYCDVDGNFPNHPPDTAVAAHHDDLISCIKEQNADLGIALDGDGDRVVAVTGSGTIVWPDELLMIFARDVISRNPGADIVFDIKCTRRLNSLISSYGGRPVIWKTGHSHMHNKIMECNSPLGGEYSGHIFFHDRWFGFDDGIYAAARLIEILSIREQSLDDILATFPTTHVTPELKIDVSDEDKFGIVDRLISQNKFKGGSINTTDGLRVDYPKAWGLVRASNTTPAITLRFEAETAESLEKIQSLFRQQLSSIDSTLVF